MYILYMYIYYTILYCIILYYIVLYYIILCYITLYYINIISISISIFMFIFIHLIFSDWAPRWAKDTNMGVRCFSLEAAESSSRVLERKDAGVWNGRDPLGNLPLMNLVDWLVN